VIQPYSVLVEAVARRGSGRIRAGPQPAASRVGTVHIRTQKGAALSGPTSPSFAPEKDASASKNPVLFGLGVLLVIAWKVAGWWGLDRWLLPRLGTPWARGHLTFGRSSDPSNIPSPPVAANPV